MNKGTSLLRSPDDLAYAELGFVEGSATMGWTDTALANSICGNVFDETQTLDVTVGPTSALYSTTRDAMLNSGANAAVVGADGRWEIIQFRTATLVSPNKYRLSSLLRGRRGTEWAMGTHTVVDRFVLLGTAGMLRPNEGNMALNALRYYKPVSLGGSLAKTYAQPFTNTGVGLKPFSPVNLRGSRDGSGNLTVTCDRRTRLAIFSRSVPVPLGEASELYDMDIFSSNTYTTIKRTVTNVGPTGLVYSAADQVADFGSAQAIVYIKVYQKSAIVGRGYAASRGV